jgi:hypothetical protein
MDSDDEAPPELVQTGTTTAETHEVTVKVPITIVTGTAHETTVKLKLTTNRVSWGW